MLNKSNMQIRVALVEDHSCNSFSIPSGRTLAHLVTLDQSAPRRDKVALCGTIAHPDSPGLGYCTSLYVPIKHLRGIPLRIGRYHLIICEICINQIQDAEERKRDDKKKADGLDTIEIAAAYNNGYVKGLEYLLDNRKMPQQDSDKSKMTDLEKECITILQRCVNSFEYIRTMYFTPAGYDSGISPIAFRTAQQTSDEAKDLIRRAEELEKAFHV